MTENPDRVLAAGKGLGDAETPVRLRLLEQCRDTLDDALRLEGVER